MDRVLLLLVVALTVAAVVFGVTVLVTGRDPGLVPAEPDGRAVPLPGARPLREADVGDVRFDTALRGYRMDQVDQAMRRAAYDIGYKSELIGVLEAEVAALREGRTADADALRRAREQAAGATAAGPSAEPRGTVPVEAATHAAAPVGSGRPGAAGVSDLVVEPVPAFAGPDAGSSTAGATPPGVDARPGAAPVVGAGAASATDSEDAPVLDADDAAATSPGAAPAARSEDATVVRPADATVARAEDVPVVRPADATGLATGGDGGVEPAHRAGGERSVGPEPRDPRSGGASAPGDEVTAPSGDTGRQGPVVRSEPA